VFFRCLACTECANHVRLKRVPSFYPEGKGKEREDRETNGDVSMFSRNIDLLTSPPLLFRRFFMPHGEFFHESMITIAYT